MSTNYGNIARENGLLFEDIIVNYYNSIDNKFKLIPYIKNITKDLSPNDSEDDILNGKLIRCSQDKVESIHSSKTTRKADIWYEYLTNEQKSDNGSHLKINRKCIGISIKMSNKGTQLQIISLDILIKYFKYNNIIIDNNIIIIFKKFLGIEQNRCWMTDMTLDEQSSIIKFLNIHKDLLYQLIFCTGLCKNYIDKAYLFIFNNSYYTKTKIISPVILTFNDVKMEYLYGAINITKKGNLELCDNVGIQRKGSGKGKQREYIQFKDRGFKTKPFKIDLNTINNTNKINLNTRNYKMVDELKVDELKVDELKVDALKVDELKVDELKVDELKVDELKVDELKVDELKVDALKVDELRGLSLFSSAGIGETYIGNYINMLVANELLDVRCKLYKHFNPKSKVINGDIKDEKVYNNIIKESISNKINFIYATPPCQSFSKAGKQMINDPRDTLFIYIISIIKIIQPKYIMIENVPEFIKLHCNINNENKLVLDVIKTELGHNYNINYDILNTSDYGVAQDRKRAIILLSHKNVKEWLIPKKFSRKITVFESIGHLPSLESGQSSDIHKWHKAKKHNERHILWMKNTPTGKSAFDNEIHYPQKDGRKIKGFKTCYKRISWDKPSPTITMANGSISSQNNVHPGHLVPDGTYSDARVLSIYELMLLTSLPSDWNIPNDISENVIRQVLGECIPPKLVLELVKNII
jgi:DNA (cytosine-5)-methyltransferase 1